MGPYSDHLWNQLAVRDDCILVDSRFAVPVQLHPVISKRNHEEHPGEEAMLGVKKYLWWPHMRKGVKLAKEYRSCTRY